MMPGIILADALLQLSLSELQSFPVSINCNLCP
jgi:hypothetical protein